MNIIETHSLSRRFGRMDAVHALDFSVPEGSTCALLGPNGAGKSTTIKLLMNLLQPSAGDARVLGVDSRKLGPAQFEQIGYVSENQELPLWMTVDEYVGYCRGFYPRWDRELEKNLRGEFSLPGDRKLGELSRGMLMKAALLSSLSYRPKLLVLDEPFSGLDPLVREEFVRGLLEVSTSGEWTILVSSHDIDEVERLCDRVALLHEGRLRFHESAEALQGRFRRVEITGAKNAAVAPGWLEFSQAGALTAFVDSRYVRDMSERGWREHFGDAVVRAQPMSLREIFLSLARSERAQARKGEAA